MIQCNEKHLSDKNCPQRGWTTVKEVRSLALRVWIRTSPESHSKDFYFGERQNNFPETPFVLKFYEKILLVETESFYH